MRILVASLVTLLAAAPCMAQGIGVSSPLNRHNLSTTGPGPVKSATVTEICVFCHAPHNARPATPLWNQAVSGQTYASYSSSTLTARPGQPTGSSKLCLSCHDGTVALGKTMTRGSLALTGTEEGRIPAASPSVLGTNLSNDHPVSFIPVTGPQIVVPAANDPVQLDAGGQVQCTSCHDPHQQDRDLITRKFLVKSNQGSALCGSCHHKAYWTANPGTHRTSVETYDATVGAHTGYSTVADNGCESCHKPHSAAWPERLLKAQEAETCGSATAQCHGGRVATVSNIYAEVNGSKRYTHPVYDLRAAQTHDPRESPTNASHPLPETSITATRHVTCSDCHNPHASYDRPATAPKASGRLAGVWGLSLERTVVPVSEPIPGIPPSVNEYEICFKCHADSMNKPQLAGSDTGFGPLPVRQVNEFNKRIAFSPAGLSFHPVTSQGRSNDVPSLKSPWTTASLMRCTDCHDNDEGPNAPGGSVARPAGPHASRWPHLLAARYETTDRVSYSAANYALCFKCHDEASILGDVTFKEHRMHVEGEQTPCFVCHDAHGVKTGVPAAQTRLINFALRGGNGLAIVSPSNSGRLEFNSTGYRQGRCYLKCHGKEHDGLGYGQ